MIQGTQKLVVAVSSSGRILGASVQENTGVSTGFTDFTDRLQLPAGQTINCASITQQGNSNVYVTVRTNTGDVRESSCTANGFPGDCTAAVSIGTVPTSTTATPALLRAFAAEHRRPA